jgi:hypothetical protein
MRDTYETPFDRYETPFDGDEETPRLDTALAEMSARTARIEASLDRLTA